MHGPKLRAQNLKVKRPASEQPDAGRRFRWALALTGVAALFIRLLYLAELRGTPLFAVPIGDGWQYDAWAQRIAAGDWLGTDAFYQSPLYPYLLGALFTAIGHDLMAVRIVQAVLGAASCVLLGLAGRAFFSGRVGVLAASLLAIYPWGIFSDGLIQKSSVDLFLTTALLATMGAFQAKQDWRWLVAAGVALAAFSLNREAARALYPIVIAWLLIHFRRERPRLTRTTWAVVFTASMAIVVTPVAMRNYRVSGEFILSTWNLGPNLYIGNHPGATGVYEPLVPGGGSAERERDDAARLAEQAMGRPLTPTQVSNYWLHRSFEFIRTDPSGWLRLVGRRLLLTLNAAQISDSESLVVYSQYSMVLRALRWFDFGILLPLAVFGAWQTRDEWRRLGVLYASFMTLGFSLVAFFVFERYRYLMIPITLLFAAAGILTVARLKVAPSRHQFVGLVLLAAGAVVAHLPLTSTYADTSFFNVGLGLLKAGRPADAIPVLHTAVERHPDDAAAYYALGVALDQSGDKQGALRAFDASVRLRPDDWEARSALGLTLQETGNTTDALAHFTEAARLKPDSAAAHTNLGAALAEVGRGHEAIAAFRVSLRLRPDDAPTRNNLAVALQAEGHLEEAAAEFRAALRIKPDYAEGHFNLAQLLQARGDSAGALEHFQRALQLQPRNHVVHMNIASLLLRLKRVRDAISHAEQAAALAPDAVEVRYFLGQTYALDGRLGDALRAFEEALTLARATEGPNEIARIEEAIRLCRAALAARGGQP